MRTLSDTIARLAALRALPHHTSPSASSLSPLHGFGSNPGALEAQIYVPEDLPSSSSLVVVLHGCTQTAAAYDQGSGWSRLAEDYGFALLYPQQKHVNNANLCFNWFLPDDTTRDMGEVSSIRQMIAEMIVRHGIDPRQVYVTGLSAGGAMANAMLATYPDVFAGGAIIAGLAYGSARTVPEAFDRMRGHKMLSPRDLQAALLGASMGNQGSPTISVWHGTNDGTVVPGNSTAIIDQWRSAHGLGDGHGRMERSESYMREVWTDASGRDAISLVTVPGMAHGTPIDSRSSYGRSAAFMLDVGVSSSEIIARSWGLTPSFKKRAQRRDEGPRAESHSTAAEFAVVGIQETIERALRAAGLMKQ